MPEKQQSKVPVNVNAQGAVVKISQPAEQNPSDNKGSVMVTQEQKALELLPEAKAISTARSLGTPSQTNKSEEKAFVEAAGAIETKYADFYYIENVERPQSKYFEYQGDDFRPRTISDLEGKPEVTANIRVIVPLKEGEKPATDPNAANQYMPLINKNQEPFRPFKEILPPYTRFFLQNVHEEDKEKMQIIETFGEFYVNFFGRSPRIYTFSGGLLNTKYHDWRNEFNKNYGEKMRGSQLAEQNAKAYITYQDTLVEGYPFSCVTDILAANPKVVPFSMTMVVTNRAPLKSKTAPLVTELTEYGDLSKIPDDIFKVVQDYIQFNRPMVAIKNY